MRIGQLKRALQARPFKPFSLRTGDGREYRVPSPEFVFIVPGGHAVIVVADDEAVDILDPFLISSIHVETKRRGRRNGRAGG